MLLLLSGGYSTAQIYTALHAASRTWDFRYEVRDQHGVVRPGIVPTVAAAHVTYDTTAAIRRTATFTVTEDAQINYLSDRLKLYARLLMPDGGWAEFPLGVFLLSTPSRHFDGYLVTRQIQAYDQLQILSDSKITNRYTAAAGAAYTDVVAAVLADAGITSTNLVSAAYLLPAALDWGVGTPRLQIIDDLLSNINYRGLWFDGDGVAQIVPYVSPDRRPIDHTYSDDGLSVLFPAMDDALDLFGIPNQFVATVSEPDQSVLTSIYTNINPASPTSTFSRGRTITSFTAETGAPDQATLDAIVARLAFEASQVYRSFTFSTGLMPNHSDSDVLQIVITGLGINDRYVETGWALDLAAGASMTHTARRVVSV